MMAGKGCGESVGREDVKEGHGEFRFLGFLWYGKGT